MLWLVASLGVLTASPSASLLRGPIPVDYTKWPMLSDMPPDLFEVGGWVRTMRTRLTVRPDGTVQGCEVEKGTGHRALERYVCAMFEQRAKFRPAIWIDGSPSYGVFRFTFKIYRGDRHSSKPDPVDLEAMVDRKTYAGVPAIVHVAFAVDQDGRTGDCSSVAPFSTGITANPPILVPFACDAVSRRYVPKAARDDAGAPVRSVQNALVRIRSD